MFNIVAKIIKDTNIDIHTFIYPHVPCDELLLFIYCNAIITSNNMTKYMQN